LKVEPNGKTGFQVVLAICVVSKNPTIFLLGGMVPLPVTCSELSGMVSFRRDGRSSRIPHKTEGDFLRKDALRADGISSIDII
jgi:hypothetical protein